MDDGLLLRRRELRSITILAPVVLRIDGLDIDVFVRVASVHVLLFIVTMSKVSHVGEPNPGESCDRIWRSNALMSNGPGLEDRELKPLSYLLLVERFSGPPTHPRCHRRSRGDKPRAYLLAAGSAPRKVVSGNHDICRGPWY